MNYRHLRNKYLGLTIAWNVVKKTPDTASKPQYTVHYGLSYCGRKDNFNRALGRDISSNRLNHHQTNVHPTALGGTYDFLSDTKLPDYDIVLLILMDIISTDAYPPSFELFLYDISKMMCNND